MPDGYDYATACRHCGTTYYPNMYGMGHCSGCGYTYHPMDKIIEMAKNENWQPPKKEQPVGMTDYEGGARASDRSSPIQAFLDEIVEGRQDEHLASISEAITTRQQVRREDVLALVQEVYGSGATINLSRK